MKPFKRIVGSIALLATSAVVHASPIEDMLSEGTAEMNAKFADVADDLSSVFSYKSASPAGSLAGGIIPVGFDIAFETSLTKLKDGSIIGDALSNELGDFAYVPFPKGHVQVGVAIPFIPFVPAIDVGLSYMNIPSVFSHYGGELKINIAGGNVVLPAVAVRLVGSSTGLTLDDKDIASLATYGAEVTVSKGFGIGIKLTPYAGLGYHMYSASSGITRADLAGENVDASTLADLTAQFPALNDKIFDDQSGGQFKWFVGANFKLLALNLGYEMDQTGGALTHTAKLGFVF